jgi:benzylsuccinate CoA-transferase BbsF subunit
MGARIIKIEGPRRPDQYRHLPIHEPGHEDIESSGAFHTLNYSKLGCTIDFTHPKGLALAKRIIAISDLVVENFAYGVMEKVGLTYDTVRAIRPDIIMIASSAMGKTGPDKAHVAYGRLLHAFSGLNSVTGYPGQGASNLGGTFTDPLTGTTMAFALLAALWHRRRTGEGQYIDLSMVEATLMQLPEFVMDYAANARVARPDGNHDGVAAPQNCYPCRHDDTWVAIAIRHQREWEAFCRALGDPEWSRDPRFLDQLGRFHNREALDELVAGWTRRFTPQEVTERLQVVGVAAGPSFSAAEMYQDPHLNARGFFVQVEHPVVGRKPIMRLPWLLDPGPNGQYWAAPTLGQHNDIVFREILGLPESEIDSLRQEGVIS